MLLGLLREQGTFAAKLLAEERAGVECYPRAPEITATQRAFFLLLLDSKGVIAGAQPTIASSSSTSKLAKGLELSESMPIIRCRELAISYYFSRARLE